MPNKTPYLNPLTAIILLVSLTFTLPLQAQKRRTTKKNVTHKEIKPEIDYSEWTDNPICRVMVADSVVVDVNDIWKSLPLPPYMGKLSYEKSTGRLVFENEFGDQRMFSDLEAGGTSAIYRQTLLADKWSEPERITINGGQFDYSNPFPMPDGQTLYFAARDSSDHEGTCLSLYTTTYDSETQSYLQPQRLPMPFSSSDDDLYYIDNESDTIAWLVTTRRQPSGKACIYTMRLNKPWEYYDAETTAPEKLKSLGMLNSIAETWTTEAVRNAVAEHARSLVAGNSPAQTRAFRFVISDDKIYTSFDQFSSEEGKRLFADYQDMQKKAEATARQTDEYRRLYHNSYGETRSRLATTIADSETRLAELRASISALANEIRKAEGRQ